MKIQNNNIYLGDTYEIIKYVADKSIDLIITDPPYLYESSGGAGAFGSNKRNYHDEYLKLYKETGSSRETERLRISASKDKSRKDLKHISNGFNISLLDELVRVMKKINIYIWCSKAQISEIMTYFEKIGCSTDILTWHKTNPIPTINNSYLSDTEYCIFAREKGVKIYGSYETKCKYYITTANTDDKFLYHHPTIKPLHIIKNLIINSSKENDIVLDVFSGSGTTAAAAKELKRKYIGFEIDPIYHQISLDRLNGMTQIDVKEKDSGILNIFDFGVASC